MRKSLTKLLIFSSILLFSVTAYAINLTGINSMPNFKVLSGVKQIVGGGPPSKENIKAAGELGIRSVVDLRTSQEGITEERDLVRRAGMKYFNIPVTIENLSHNTAQRLSRIIQNSSNRPMIIHCSNGNRAAALYALYMRRYQNVDPDLALQLGNQKGLRNGPYKDKVIELLNK